MERLRLDVPRNSSSREKGPPLFIVITYFIFMIGHIETLIPSAFFDHRGLKVPTRGDANIYTTEFRGTDGHSACLSCSASKEETRINSSWRVWWKHVFSANSADMKVVHMKGSHVQRMAGSSIKDCNPADLSTTTLRFHSAANSRHPYSGFVVRRASVDCLLIVALVQIGFSAKPNLET